MATTKEDEAFNAHYDQLHDLLKTGIEATAEHIHACGLHALLMVGDEEELLGMNCCEEGLQMSMRMMSHKSK